MPLKESAEEEPPYEALKPWSLYGKNLGAVRRTIYKAKID